MGNDLFIRKVYEHKGIKVIVDIDFDKGTISLVEKNNGAFIPKKYIFAKRELSYMRGWQNILEAMAYAVENATNLLRVSQEAKEKETIELVSMSLGLNKHLKDRDDG